MSLRSNAGRFFALALFTLAVAPRSAHAILWRSSYVPRGEGGSTGNTSSLRSGDVVDVIVVVCAVVLGLIVLFFVVRHVLAMMAKGGRRRKRAGGGRIRGRTNYDRDPDRRPRGML